MRIILVLLAILICFSPAGLAQTPQEMNQKMKGALTQMKKRSPRSGKQLQVARVNMNEALVKELEVS